MSCVFIYYFLIEKTYADSGIRYEDFEVGEVSDLFSTR